METSSGGVVKGVGRGREEGCQKVEIVDRKETNSWLDSVGNTDRWASPVNSRRIHAPVNRLFEKGVIKAPSSFKDNVQG